MWGEHDPVHASRTVRHGYLSSLDHIWSSSQTLMLLEFAEPFAVHSRKVKSASREGRDGAAGGSGSPDTSGASAEIEIPEILRRAESEPVATGEIGSMLLTDEGWRSDGAEFETTSFRRFRVNASFVSNTGCALMLNLVSSFDLSEADPDRSLAPTPLTPCECNCAQFDLLLKTTLTLFTAANPTTGS